MQTNTSLNITLNSRNNNAVQYYNIQLPEYVDEPQWLRVSRLVVETLIALFGVIGNIGVVVAISRCPFMLSVTNMFIRNLAIADIGVLMLSFPLAVVKEQTLYHWPLGETMCQVVYPLSEIFIGVSVWSMVIIAIDRYRGIVNDSHIKSLKTAVLICILPWIVSFLVNSLPLLIVTRIWEGYGIKDCLLSWPVENYQIMNRGYTTISSLFNYFLPLSIILWTYCKIFQKIDQSDTFNRNTLRSFHEASSSRYERRRMKRNNRAKRILTPVVVIFAAALLPVNVLRLVLVFIPSLVTFRYFWVIYNFCIVTTVLNSSCNPFIYAIVSDNFRVAFKSMFKSRKKFTSIRRSSSLQFRKGASQVMRSLRRVSYKNGSTSVAIGSTYSTSSSDPV